VYHCNDDIYGKIREQTDIYVIDPKVKDIKFALESANVKSPPLIVFLSSH